MSFFHTKPTISLSEARSTGPTTSFAENFGLVFDEMRAGHTSHSERLMRQRAEGERRQIIEETSGKSFNDTLRPYMPPGVDPRAAEMGIVEGFSWEPVVSSYRSTLTSDQQVRILTGDELDRRAGEIAFDIEADAASARSRTRTLRGEAGLLAGELVGRMSDPINMASMVLGAPAATGVLRFAVTEALIGGGTEAAIQPFVQKWRDRAGLREVDPLLEVGMAAGGAGVLAGGGYMATAAGRRAYEAIKGLTRSELAQAHAELRPGAADEELAARSIVEQDELIPDAQMPRSDHLRNVADAEQFPPPAQVARTLNEQPEQIDDLDGFETQMRTLTEDVDFEVPVGTRVDETGELVPEVRGARQILDEIEGDKDFIEQIRVCLKG